MAMFGSYFGLCPLIDHRSLLGISEVSENGKILVTLGKNMSMQYNLADQKQTLSWTTKEKFTSPVLFDFETNKYVAVFNQMYMRCWDSKDSSLDKVKKLKFKKNIFTVIMSKRNGFVIFQNGFTIKLNEALLNHKTLEPEGILNENEYIVDVLSCTLNANVYIGLVVGNSDSSETSRLLWAVFDSREDGDTYSQLSLKRDGCELAGIAFHLSNEQVEILTFWSDGKLFVKPLEDKTDNLGEIYSVIESISGNHPVSIVSLDKDYIAMYGDNSNQEGALLIIYNMQFKVTQCRQPFKLLTIGAKLWSIQENLILPVGQNLAVVPFYLEKEQLSALVGSHRMNPNNTKDVLIVHNLKEVTWSKLNDVTDSTINNDVKKITEDYLEQGYAECTIFQEIYPSYVEKNDVKSLELLLKTFDDIPERYFIELLKYFLEVSDKVFKKFELHSNDSYPENLQPYKRYEILITILKKPINEIALLPFLRTKLDLNNVLKLLSFIMFLLVDDIDSPDVKFTEKLLEWICLILDSNYQTFLLSKDENVIKILSDFSELVSNELLCLDDMQKLLSVVDQVSKKKKIAKIVESDYIVEKLDLS